MTYTFGIPNDLQALWSAGKLVRRGALLINSQGGGIVGHLQETAAKDGLSWLSRGVSGALSPLTSPATLVSSIIGNVQNEQIKGRLNTVGETLGMVQEATGRVEGRLNAVGETLGMVQKATGRVEGRLESMGSVLQTVAGLQVAGVAASVASIGVSALGTIILYKKLQSLQQDLQAVPDLIVQFREEWRAAELQKILVLTMNKVERLDSAMRRDPRPALHDAETTLDICFDRIHSEIKTLYTREAIPIDVLRMLLDGMALSGTARIKALFLLEEPEMAGQAAKKIGKELTDLTRKMPADLMMERLAAQGLPETPALELAGVLSETRHRIASIPSLVERLNAEGIPAKEYLRAAEAEKDAPVLFLPALPSGSC